MNYISGPPPAVSDDGPMGLSVLGSTGSIGVSALKAVESLPGRFRVTALSCARRVKELAVQAVHFRPPHLAVYDGKAADALKSLLPSDYEPNISTGQEGYEFIASLPEVERVLSAQVGAAGLRATVAAALAGKTICLANKESLVLAGGLLRDICAFSGASILPVDSEHNAVFQALAGRPGQSVRRVVLTASGGPFRGFSADDLGNVDCRAALKHPKWNMGPKISIDSATLMNKGLEIIEAKQLFGLPDEKISVVIHPQSIIHSLVEFNDGSLMAHLGTPDMRMPIAHALAWPECLDSGVKPLDLVAESPLTFEKPDERAFPCLALAKAALKSPAKSIILNAANEIAVGLFLAEKIKFTSIAELIAKAMDNSINHDNLFDQPAREAGPVPGMVERILELDRHTRQETQTAILR